MKITIEATIPDREPALDENSEYDDETQGYLGTASEAAMMFWENLRGFPVTVKIYLNGEWYETFPGTDPNQKEAFPS